MSYKLEIRKYYNVFVFCFIDMANQFMKQKQKNESENDFGKNSGKNPRNDSGKNLGKNESIVRLIAY